VDASAVLLVLEVDVKVQPMSMLIGFTVLAACAAAPPPKPAATASAGVAAHAGAAPRAATQSTQRAAKSAEPDADLHNYARAQGYKSVTRNGKQVWCRQEPTLGSHFETVYCLTDAVLADQKRLIEQNQQEMIHDYRPSCVQAKTSCNF
jgi:hypothetical protein